MKKRKRIYTIDVLLKLKIADKIANIYDLSDRDQKTIKNESIKIILTLIFFYQVIKFINIIYYLVLEQINFTKRVKISKVRTCIAKSHSHNTYLNIISEQGTIIFLLFIYLIYNNLFKTYKYNKKIIKIIL